MIRRALLALLLVCLPALAHAQAVVTYLDDFQDASSTSTYTFSSVPIGTAAADRYIIVGAASAKTSTSSCTISGGSIGGVTATIVRQNANIASSTCRHTSLLIALVPSGTTANIVLNYPAAMFRAGIVVYSVTNLLSPTPFSQSDSDADDPTGTVSIGPNGFAIAVAYSSGATTTSWTGLTETFDGPVDGISLNTYSSALLEPATYQSAITVTADFAAPNANASTGLWASWGAAKIDPAATTATNWVTSTGSATGGCTESNPCNLTRAFAIAGTAAAPPGAYFTIAAGYYSQAEITTTGGGVSGYPVRMVGAGTGASGTFITGLSYPLEGAVWSATAGRTYTYQTPFSNTTGPAFQVDIFGQRQDTTTWVPILVDSRSAPDFTASFRAFTLDEPVRYTKVSTIADVEAQHCTYAHDTTNDILYMHPCREAAPTDDDKYYAGPDEWGNLVYVNSGDYLTLEQVTFWHMNGDAIFVNTTAFGNRFTNIKAVSAKMLFRGNQTVSSDWLLKENIIQGPPHANCYGPDYGGTGLSSRSCWSWNTSGSSEYLLIVGQEDVAGNPQFFDNIVMERGWNGYAMYGPTTLDHASCWGLDNHCGQAYGTGFTLSNGIFSTSQDSLYLEGENFNNVTINNNLFRNGVLVWCSRDGHTQPDITCPTNWTFTSNILGSFVTDTVTQPSLNSDCNAWIPRSSGATIWRMTPVNGIGSDPQLETLTEIQALTNDDDNSVFHDYPSMTDGSIFLTHSSQETYPMDFTLAPGGAALLTTCGAVAGPDTLEGEAEVPAGGNVYRFRFRHP